MRWGGCLNGRNEGKGVYVVYNSRHYANLKTNKRVGENLKRGVD